MIEQRNNLRVPVNFHSSFSSIGTVGAQGTIIDISPRGCRIESSTDIQIGASVEVRIAVREHELPIRIDAAVVRWKREQQFGLEFEVIAPTELAYLQDLCAGML